MQCVIFARHTSYILKNKLKATKTNATTTAKKTNAIDAVYFVLEASNFGFL